MRPAARALLLLALVGLADVSAGCARLGPQTPEPHAFRLVAAQMGGRDDAATLTVSYLSEQALVVSVRSAEGLLLGSRAANASPAIVPLPPLATYFDGQGPLTLDVLVAGDAGQRLHEENVTFYAPSVTPAGAARAVGDEGAGLAIDVRNRGDMPSLARRATLTLDGETVAARVRNATVYPDATATIVVDAPGLAVAPGTHALELEVDFVNGPALVANATAIAGLQGDVAPLGWDESGLTGLRLDLAGRGPLPVAPASVTLAFANASVTLPLGAPLLTATTRATLEVTRPADALLRPANARDVLALRLADAQGATLLRRNLTLAPGNLTLNITGASFACDPAPGLCALSGVRVLVNQSAGAVRYVASYRLGIQSVNGTATPPQALHQGTVTDDLAVRLAPLRRGLYNLNVAAVADDGTTLATTRAQVNVTG